MQGTRAVEHCQGAAKGEARFAKRKPSSSGMSIAPRFLCGSRGSGFRSV